MENNVLKPGNGIKYAMRLIPKKGVAKEMVKPIRAYIGDNTIFRVVEEGIVIQGKLYSRSVLQAAVIQITFNDDKERLNLIDVPSEEAIKAVSQTV